MSQRPDEVLTAFGARVRELRTAAGHSQEAFAAACGLDRTYVSGVERGRRNLSLRNIDALARALGCSPAVLFAAPDGARVASQPRSLLDLFGVDLTFLSQVVQANPSLRGIILGHLAERKLWERLAADPRLTALRKDDDHDRDSKGDLVVTYQGFEFRIEVKSLQTNSIKMFEPASGKWMKKVVERPLPRVAGKRQKRKWEECELYRTHWRQGGADARYTGSVQCDASDRRSVVLPTGRTVEATNLVVGEFDLLAMGLYAFRERWEFGFLLNRDLPRSTSPKYAAEDRQHLLKTLIPVTWPLGPACHPDPFPLLDQLVADRRRTTPGPSASGRR